MVMEYYGDIIQAFQVGPTVLEPWDYDPRRSAEMSVDISGYVGIIAPQEIIQHLVSYWVQGPKLPTSKFSWYEKL